jgi:tRNA synthetases class I (R)
MQGNLLDEAMAALEGRGLAEDVTLLPLHRPNAQADVMVIIRREDADPGPLAAALQDVGMATHVDSDGRLLARCADDSVELLGWSLEAGDPTPMATSDLQANRRHVVHYADPNATKALHVGHLRNIAVGNGIAHMLKAAGSNVTQQSQIGDMGRGMAEALAGYLHFGEGSTPRERGVKSDHFIGHLYRQYVATLSDEPANGAKIDPALSREDIVVDDRASQLQWQLQAGDAQVVSLWNTARQWAMEGQEETLRRLTVTFDRILTETDFVDHTAELEQLALSHGIARRVDTGAVMFETGEDHYPHLLLNRSDGLSTAHLRHIALWWGMQPMLAGWHSILVMGNEWEPLSSYTERIIRTVTPPGAPIHPSTTVMHGMVTVGGEAVKSSRGDPLLIDELLDQLISRPELNGVREEHTRMELDTIAVMTALGAVLAHPLSKRLDLTFDQLVSERSSAGWALARAWADAWHPRHDGKPEPAPDDVRYRYLVVQSQIHRGLLERSLVKLDPEPLVRFYSHLGRWYLEAEPSPAVARLMRTILGRGLGALGLPAAPPV